MMRIEWRVVKEIGAFDFDRSALRPMSPDELLKACVGE